MALKNPPAVNGLMTLTDAEKTAIKDKLIAIRTAFVETDDQPVCDTFYLTSTFNKQNVGSELNGDTVDMLIAEIDTPQGV